MKYIIRPTVTFTLTNDQQVSIHDEETPLGTISPGVHKLLCLFNGYLTNQEMIELLQYSFQFEPGEAKEKFELLVDRYWYILEESEGITRDDLEPFSREPAYINFDRLRSLTPKALTISLTRQCYVKCRYCYAGVNRISQNIAQRQLDLEILEKIFAEASQLQVSTINFTGGDPFMREDIFQILNRANEYGFQITISTKKPLKPDEIKQLKEATNQIQVSLDAADDELQRKLVSNRHYASQMLESIRLMVAEGITVDVNAVITALTIQGIPQLLETLDRLGVNSCFLTAYTNNLWNSDDELFPTAEEYRKLNAQIDQMDLTMAVTPPPVGDPSSESNSDETGYINACTGGLLAFTINPSGDVGFCERVAYHEEYSIGNIYEQSIWEIWSSPELKRLYQPDMEQFKGTKCYQCDSFDYCAHERGFCYLYSLLINDRFFSPDYDCKYYTDKIKIS